MSENTTRRLLIHMEERAKTAKVMAEMISSHVWPHRSDNAAYFRQAGEWQRLCDDVAELDRACADVTTDLEKLAKLKTAHKQEASCEPTS